MKWEDLEPGDVLEYTEEYINLVLPYSGLPKWWVENRIFTIEKISVPNRKRINISFVGCMDHFPMNTETGADAGYTNYYAGPAFKVIKVAENK